MKNLRKKISGDSAAKLSLLGNIKFFMLYMVGVLLMTGLGVSKGIGMLLVAVISIVISESFGFFESNKVKTSFRKPQWPLARNWLKIASIAIVVIAVDQLGSIYGLFGEPHAKSIGSSVSFAIILSYLVGQN